jgi:hypothetical protein
MLYLAEERKKEKINIRSCFFNIKKTTKTINNILIECMCLGFKFKLLSLPFFFNVFFYSGGFSSFIDPQLDKHSTHIAYHIARIIYNKCDVCVYKYMNI